MHASSLVVLFDAIRKTLLPDELTQRYARLNCASRDTAWLQEDLLHLNQFFF